MDKKILLGIIIATVVIIFVGIWVVSATNTPASSQITASTKAKATVNDPTSYDWGTIAYSGGIVTKDFTIKNTGTDILKLSNLKTSCHCTKAHIAIDGNTSPDFGMDSLSSWIGQVPPGNEAKLTVMFDPAFHGPSGVGPVTRFVSVNTNAAANPQLTFTLTGTVVNK